MPGYAVKTETLRLGDSDFEIRSLLDRDQYADPEGLAEALGISPAQWPLFGQVWPTARILAGAMQSIDIEGRRFLEVGAGLGLASLLLHRRGAGVTASEYHPLAAAFLQENLRLNGMSGLPTAPGDWSRENPLLGRFDVIIGSDVLYDRGLPAMLAAFIDRHSCANVEVVIADPDRGNRVAFVRAMEKLGYAFTSQPAAATLPTGEPYKGRLLHFKRATP